MLASLIVRALLVVGGIMFVTAMAAFVHPRWFRDPKTGVIAPFWKALPTVWEAPIIHIKLRADFFIVCR